MIYRAYIIYILVYAYTVKEEKAMIDTKALLQKITTLDLMIDEIKGDWERLGEKRVENGKLSDGEEELYKYLHHLMQKY